MAGVVLVLICAGAGLTAIQGGAATGTLTTKAGALHLAHAYAIAEKDKGKPATENYRIFLTDRPLPASSLADEFERRELLFARKVQGIEAIVTSDNDVVTMTMYAPGLSATGASSTGMTFEKAKIDATTIAGTVRYHLDETLEATFTAPIFSRAVPTRADLESEPANAVRTFIKAAAARDKAALQKIVRAEDAKDLDGADARTILTELSDAGQVMGAMSVVWIDVDGDRGRVLLESQDGSEKIRLILARENGRWKVASPLK